MSKQLFILRAAPHPSRELAIDAVRTAQDGYVVRISEPTRNLEQSALFHALCSDISKVVPWAGKMRSPTEWKVILVSGHSVATKQGSDMVPGLEGEFCNLRESTAAMSVKRIGSLIEYAQAFLAMHTEGKS